MQNICRSYITLESRCGYMNKLSLIAIGITVTAATLLVGMTTPAAFA